MDDEENRRAWRDWIGDQIIEAEKASGKEWPLVVTGKIERAIAKALADAGVECPFVPNGPKAAAIAASAKPAG